MARYHFDDIDEREIMPGLHGRLVHTERMTIALWRIDQGAVVALHGHPHEQITHVLEGRFAMEVDGERHELGPGNVLVIPSGARHSGRALTACRILDYWSPPRDDYR